MPDLNTILLLKNLSSAEVNLFRQFLNSPYHNRSKKIIKLYNTLIKFYPEFNGRKLTKKYIMEQISPGTEYNDSTFRALMHDLYSLAQSFLVNESLKNNLTDNTLLLLKDLYKRKLYSVINSRIKFTEKKLKNRVSESSIYYYRFLTESYKYNIHSITSSGLKKVNASKKLGIIAGSDIYLTLYYLTEIISDFTNQAINRVKFNIEEPDNFSDSLISAINFDKIFRLFNRHKELIHIVILYKALFDLFSDITNRNKFEIYRDTLKSSEKLLSGDESSFHYSRLISCCILNHETDGSKYYNNELFFLYNYFIRKKLYSDNKTSFMPSNLYRTVLLNALRLKKYKWALNFIKKYINESEERSRNNLLNWSYAVYYNEINDNTRSMYYISLIKVDYFIFKYDLYNIKLKIYYELDDPQKVIDFIHTYKEFLRNDKFFSGTRKVLYMNFIKAVELLVKIRENKNLFSIEYFKDNYTGSEKILYKDWLLNKLQTIEKAL